MTLGPRWLLSSLLIAGAALFAVGVAAERHATDHHTTEATPHVNEAATGETGAAGVETIGQGVLTVVITSLLLLILSVIPVAVGAGLFFYWRPLPMVAVAFATLAGGVILAAESFGLMHLLGKSLERLEPTQVG